jgi:hypothetical protein
MLRPLKSHLFAEYNGFADKRIKNLKKCDTFIIDDRNDSDCGANKKPLSHFCMILARVEGDNKINVILSGNVPQGLAVEKWLKDNEDKLKENGGNARLAFTLTPEDYSILDSLAVAIAAITAPGAPRYSVKSYKYVCPRVAKSLRRLKKVLGRAWPGGERIGLGL